MKARVLSLLVHGIAIALLIAISPRSVRQFSTRELVRLVDMDRTPLLAPYIRTGGGGGGGRSPLPASFGVLPRSAPRQFVPPSTRQPEFRPALMMEATLVAPADVQIPSPLLARIGDPFGQNGPPSDGPGRNGGIGAGDSGGIGNRKAGICHVLLARPR
jgi:hypothetical protein